MNHFPNQFELCRKVWGGRGEGEGHSLRSGGRRANKQRSFFAVRGCPPQGFPHQFELCRKVRARRRREGDVSLEITTKCKFTSFQ